MPAANFGSSDYITLGYLVSTYDLEHDEGYMEDIRAQALEDWYDDNPDWNLDENGEEIPIEDLDAPDLSSYIDDILAREEEWMYEDAYYGAKRLISDANLHYFDMEIESGYYEGYYIDISWNRDYLESENEKEDLYQEIAKIGEILTELASYGWRTVSSTCYSTYYAEEEQTMQDISEALAAMVEEVQETKVYDSDEPGQDYY